jgi:sugar fermentation stimulation protein A
MIRAETDSMRAADNALTDLLAEIVAAPQNLLIRFPEGSRLARFRRREKRFLAEVEAEGKQFWVHCNNSGSMLGLLRPGATVLISRAQRQDRRLPYTLELIQRDSIWVGVNTLVPNRILHLAWKTGILPEVLGYEHLRREAQVGQSRLDAVLNGPRGTLWVETKNVTLVEDSVAYFPDAVTDRGQKHLRELIQLAHKGDRVACFFLVQRPDADCFGPADFIDSAFADLFREALREGVEAWPYQGLVSPDGIGLGPRLPLHDKR